jgi:hypothetical protein
MFCNDCGVKNPDGAKVCNSCGATLQKADTPTTNPELSKKKEFTLTQLVEAALVFAVVAGLFGLAGGGFPGMVVFFVIGFIGGFIVVYAAASLIYLIRR